MKAKKGQAAALNGAIAFGIAFLVLVVVLFSGATILENLRNQELVTQQTSVTNETLTMPAATGGVGFNGSVSVAAPRLGLVNSTIKAYNVSNLMVYGQDYVVDSLTAGTFRFITNQSGALVNVSYDFLSSEENAPANVSQGAITGVQNFSGQFGNMGLVAVIVVIIALLLAGMAFVFSRIGR